MKKVLKVGMAGLMAVSMFGCSSSKEEDNTKVITIGISPDYAPYESLNKETQPSLTKDNISYIKLIILLLLC